MKSQLLLVVTSVPSWIIPTCKKFLGRVNYAKERSLINDANLGQKSQNKFSKTFVRWFGDLSLKLFLVKILETECLDFK